MDFRIPTIVRSISSLEQYKALTIIKENDTPEVSVSKFYGANKPKLMGAGINQQEFKSFVNEMMTKEVVRGDMRPARFFDNYYKNLEIELEEILEEKKHKKKQQKLTSWQVKWFWPLAIFAAVGGGYSIIKIVQSIVPSNEPSIEESLQDYLKKEDIQQMINEAQMEVLDEVYSDSSIVNPK